MVHITSLEKGLKWILGRCPNITLTASDIQDIIDGKQNEVISKCRGTWVDPNTHKCNDSSCTSEDDHEKKSDGLSFKDLLTEDKLDLDTSDKSFDEYFKD